MRRALIAGLTLAALLATLGNCRGGHPERVDLACDVIRHDSRRDLHRLEGRMGAYDAALEAVGRGRLVVRAYDYAAPVALGRSLGVVVVDSASGARASGGSDGAPVALALAPGTYGVRVSCAGCSRADTVLAVRAGRSDTLDAYLTRFPTACEATRGEHTSRAGSEPR